MQTDFCIYPPGECTHHLWGGAQRAMKRLVDAAPVTEEFCGAYKGDHIFDRGVSSCRCGRAFKTSNLRRTRV